MRHKYVFSKDDKCITLSKLVKVTDKEAKNYGEDREVLIGYYSSLDGIITKLIMLEVIDKGTVQDLFNDIRIVIPTVKALVYGELKGDKHG